MITGLERIAQNRLKYPDSKHINLIHHVNVKNLLEVHARLDRKKAVGVDQVSKGVYEQNLANNLNQLVSKMRMFTYRPHPTKRVYIPKAGSKKLRPLGIPSYEDKLVQGAMADILNEVYEPLFYDFFYGFRKDKDCHKAIKHLTNMIYRNSVIYIVDADIKGFFDNVDHRTLIKFLEEEIGDKSFLRYIVRFLKAGIMEDGKRIESDRNIPQGGLISPILGNVYLHYALDMWFEVVVKKYCKGYSGMIRYADDFVCCFEYETEAREFYKRLQERLAKFKLEIEVNKSKIIHFGRNTGNAKGTFDFLGFTFISGVDRKGRYRTIRLNSKKKMSAKMKAENEWIRANMHMPVNELIKKLNTKLVGHYRYYGITGNYDKLEMFRWYVLDRLKVWFNRRSQKAKMTWDKFNKTIEYNPVVKPKVYHTI